MKKAKTPAREFELLVQSFEQACGPNVAIKSPDRLRDIHTGQMREVDVSLRFPAEGDVPAKFWFVECRKRGRKADVCWVEQIATKVKSVGADAAILVAEGFSKPAMVKAKALDLQIRTVEECRDPDKMGALFFDQKYVGMVTQVRRCEYVEWFPVFAQGIAWMEDSPTPDVALDQTPIRLTADDKCFRVDPLNEMLSFDEVFARSIQPMLAAWFERWGVGAERQRRGWTIQIPEGSYISLVTGFGEVPVLEFKGLADVWCEEWQEGPERAYSYRDADGVIAKAVEHTSKILGQAMRVRMIDTHDTGLLTFSRQPIEDDSPSGSEA